LAKHYVIIPPRSTHIRAGEDRIEEKMATTNLIFVFGHRLLSNGTRRVSMTSPTTILLMRRTMMASKEPATTTTTPAPKKSVGSTVAVLLGFCACVVMLQLTSKNSHLYDRIRQLEEEKSQLKLELLQVRHELKAAKNEEGTKQSSS